MKLSHSIQRRATRMAKGLEGKPYKKQLWSAWMSLRGDLITFYNLLMRGRRGAGTGLCTARIQNHGVKLSQGRFRSDIRKKLFA